MAPRRTRPGWLASVMLGAGLVVLTLPSPASAVIEKCQAGIEKASAKLEGKILKALQKCKDAYRKAIVKGVPLFGPGFAAEKCQIVLNKTLPFPDTNVVDGISAMQAAKNALNTLRNPAAPPAACSDADLEALGHLSEAIWGDKWQRWLMAAKLRAAYNQQILLVRDTINIFRSLNGTNCPLCALLLDPPCYKHACELGTGTTSNAQPFVNSSGFPLATVPLNGRAVIELCRVPWILGNDLALMGNPARSIRPTTILGVHVCTVGIGAEGYLNCGSSNPKVNYQTCQDHVVSAPETDDCAAAGFTTCLPSQADLVEGDPTGAVNKHVGTTNGGACLKLTPVGAAAGDAFALNTTQITLVTAAQVGPDGTPCTRDDTAPPGIPATIPLTTGSAQAFVFDANNTSGTNFNTPAVVGTPFNCANVLTSNLSPGKLVGAFPALHSLCIAPPCDNPTTGADEGGQPIDSATTFVLTCQ